MAGASESIRQVNRTLFIATILLGSFLLFLVQPMVARMALPRLGGAPNVWNSAMILYQALLLAGYAYAHRLVRLPIRSQVRLHLLLFAVFALTLPVTLYRLPPPAPGWEVLWVPLMLMLTIGPVFVIVSAQAPLMQRWFVSQDGAGEPWALYAASNVGSFAGLIAYPILAEPLLSLDKQSLAWSAGYLLLGAMVGVCAWSRRKVRSGHFQAEEVAGEHEVCRLRILHWLALSAVPSGLMLSTTTHLTTDIFAMPLLWVIPLGLYLLSFVIAFSANRHWAWAIGLFAPIVVLFAGGLAMVSRHSGNMTLALAGLMLLFVTSVTLHAKLYDLRPHYSRLTLFYLAMSLGGALGGAFTAIVAPVMFDWVWEHPLLVFLAALLMPLPELLRWRRMEGLEPGMAILAASIFLALGIFLAWLLAGVASQAEPSVHRVFLTILLCGIGLLLMSWRWMFVCVLVMLMLAQGGITTIMGTLEGQRTRSYFGVYTVRDYETQGLRMLIHGTTLHGQQSTDPARANEVMTYYGPGSGVAIALSEADELYGSKARVGVIGLGTGTLACLRGEGQDWTFFEIDPTVVDFSRNGTFTFLRNCTPDADMVIGDARLELEKIKPGSFDMLIVDAFTSDAIPLHLLTREAMETYLRSLSPDGLLVFHISNRYIELEPVLAALARDLGLFVLLRSDNPRDRVLLTPSAWAALSRNESRIEALAESRPDAPWENLDSPAERPWTDDHASILPYIRWKKLLGDL